VVDCALNGCDVPDAAISANPPNEFVFVRKSGTTAALSESDLSSCLAASAKLNELADDAKIFLGGSCVVGVAFEDPNRPLPKTGVLLNALANGEA
jgi:hypothetical protein